MRVVIAASECVPFAKTGGLADVVGALAPELSLRDALVAYKHQPALESDWPEAQVRAKKELQPVKQEIAE